MCEPDFKPLTPGCKPISLISSRMFPIHGTMLLGYPFRSKFPADCSQRGQQNSFYSQSLWCMRTGRHVYSVNINFRFFTKPLRDIKPAGVRIIPCSSNTCTTTGIHVLQLPYGITSQASFSPDFTASRSFAS